MPDALKVASDIGKRLAELRECLGENQRDFAARFGRGWKQVSMWERGHQKPRPSVLALALEKNRWPSGIFEEGGPRPAEIDVKALKSSPEARTGAGGDRSATRAPQPGRRREDIELRAMAIHHAAGRLDVIARLIRAYRDAGKSPGPGTLDEWLDILASDPVNGPTLSGPGAPATPQSARPPPPADDPGRP
jgi:transcriptional regulator with XRE-family HTH domain